MLPIIIFKTISTLLYVLLEITVISVLITQWTPGRLHTVKFCECYTSRDVILNHTISSVCDRSVHAEDCNSYF